MSLRLTFVALAFSLVACGPGTDSSSTEPPVPQAPATVAPSTTADSGTSTAGDLPCDVAQVFAKNCVNCHGSTPANGAPDSLATRADLLKTRLRGGTLAQRSLEGMKDSQVPMPPSYAGARVTAAEIAVVQGWVNAGTPTGMCSSGPAAALP